MYLEHCAACYEACIPVPTVEEWIARIDEAIAERQEALQRDEGAPT